MKSDPVAISIPDVLTDAVADTVGEAELEKTGEPESSSEEEVAPVADKSTKVAPAESATKNFIPWPSIQITQEDRRPESTPEGVCSRLCERNGRGFLYVSHDECWCRCVVPVRNTIQLLAHHSVTGALFVIGLTSILSTFQECSGGGGHGLRSLAPALRNGGCRDQCRSINYKDSPDGFYDRDRDRCVCQCSPCAEFDWGHGHGRCK